MRVPKTITNLKNKIDSLRREQDNYLKDELLNAQLDYEEAISSKLLGKCFIRKYDKSKYKTSWSYVKYIDIDEEGFIRSVSFPYLFSELDRSTISFSSDSIFVRHFEELRPISEEKFQSKLADVLGIIMSAAKRSDNGNT